MTKAKKKMNDRLLCPYCGSDDYEIYDSETAYPENIDHCVCEKCGKLFDAFYLFSYIEKID